MSNLTESVLETVAGATQDFTPTKQICAFLNGFHVYDSDRSRSVEANHYCSHQSKNFRQCLIYDSPAKDARLIGVEYMIPIARFETLPTEEKKLWHSHVYEVKSGMLQMPKPSGVPVSVWDAAETREMKEIVNWMGKTFHFWQVDRGDDLPLGLPELMMSATKDGDIHSDIIQGRDERMNTESLLKRELRNNIAEPQIPAGADVGLKHVTD